MKLKTIGKYTLFLLIGALLSVAPAYSQNEQSKRDIVLPDVEIVGRKRFCCSGVPSAMSVGPSNSSPRWLTLSGASACAYSS